MISGLNSSFRQLVWLLIMYIGSYVNMIKLGVFQNLKSEFLRLLVDVGENNQLHCCNKKKHSELSPFYLYCLLTVSTVPLLCKLSLYCLPSASRLPPYCVYRLPTVSLLSLQSSYFIYHPLTVYTVSLNFLLSPLRIPTASLLALQSPYYLYCLSSVSTISLLSILST